MYILRIISYDLYDGYVTRYWGPYTLDEAEKAKTFVATFDCYIEELHSVKVEK
jgi:hypothetical protein